jgi:tripartite ATP-independent transporter DctM subunit
MDSALIGIIGMLALLIMIFLSFHVAISMAVVGLLGTFFMLGPMPALLLLKRVPFSVCSTFAFAVIPLFIVMGLVVYESGLVSDIFAFIDTILVKIKGGLMIATMIAGAFFGACSGSSLAAAVTFSKIGVPEMIKRDYKASLACGSVAALGTQAALIPPSTLLIIYAIVVEISVGKMLLAGLLPGVLSNILYIIVVMIIGRYTDWIPPAGERFIWAESKKHIKWIWPLPVIFALVFIVIYLGICTPTESAALGVSISITVSIIIIMAKKISSGRKFSMVHVIREVHLPASFRAACNNTAMIFFILIGAFIFGRFIAASGAPVLISEFISGLEINRWFVFIGFALTWLILGTFMSATAIIVIIMPVILPTLQMLNFNILWFGIIVAKLSEIAMITPPVGMNLYAVKGTVGETTTFGGIVKGTLPFLCMDILTLIILTSFPIISLIVPESM